MFCKKDFTSRSRSLGLGLYFCFAKIYFAPPYILHYNALSLRFRPQHLKISNRWCLKKCRIFCQGFIYSSVRGTLHWIRNGWTAKTRTQWRNLPGWIVGLHGRKYSWYNDLCRCTSQLHLFQYRCFMAHHLQLTKRTSTFKIIESKDGGRLGGEVTSSKSQYFRDAFL